MAEPLLITSWDDGHPADRRLADRLARLGIAATFFAPLRNAEGRAVMTAADLRALAAGGFEVAAHTLDHRRLTSLPEAEARRQLVDGRRRLEDILGAEVSSFAYPGGRIGWRGRRLVAEAGFRYARCTRMFCLSPGDDALAIGTTVQFHPHRPAAVLRNWMRQGAGVARLRLALRWLNAGDLEAAVAAMADAAFAGGGALHLWGHSWEIEEQGLWPVLERVMAGLAARTPTASRLTVGALGALQFP